VGPDGATLIDLRLLPDLVEGVQAALYGPDCRCVGIDHRYRAGQERAGAGERGRPGGREAGQDQVKDERTRNDEG
jgi:hypothetical protein